MSKNVSKTMDSILYTMPNRALKVKDPRELEDVSTPRNNTKRVISGYLATYDKDRIKDVFTSSALKMAARDLLKEGSNTLFFNHDRSIPIGKILSTKVDKVGLFITAMVSKATDVNDYWIKIKEGVLNAFSIGFYVKEGGYERIYEEETGKFIETKISAIEAIEGSVVGIPMNRYCSIVDVQGKAFKFPKLKMPKGKKMKNKRSNGRGDVMTKNISSLIDEKVSGEVASIKKEFDDFKKTLLDSVAEIVKNKGEAPPKPKTEIEVLTEKMEEMSKNFNKSIEDLAKRKGYNGEADDDGDNNGSGKSDELVVDMDNPNSPEAIEAAKYLFTTADGEKQYSEMNEETKKWYKGVYIRQMVKSQSND